MATVTIPKVYLNFRTSLAAKISNSASSFTLSRSTDPDGTSLSGTYLLTFDKGTAFEEDAIATMVGATGTFVTRGLSQADGATSVTANKFEHDLGASVEITSAPLIQLTRLLGGTDTFNAVNWLGVNSISGLATPTSGETTKAANVAYVNAVAISGAPQASSVGLGIVELAIASEAATGAASGGAGILAIPASICNATSSAAVLIPVTEADGDLSIGFMPLDVTWTFTGVVDIGTAANWKLANTAFTGSMADLNEAATFFANTAISASNANELIGGAATTLHVHANNKKLTKFSTAVTVGNTAVETNLMSATVAANTLGTANLIRGKIMISSFTTGGSIGCTLRLKYGASTLGSIGLDVGSASFSGRQGWIEFELYADGATNSQEGTIMCFHHVADSLTASDAPYFNRGTNTSAVDSTQSQTLAITLEWASADAGSTITVENGYAEIIQA